MYFLPNVKNLNVKYLFALHFISFHNAVFSSVTSTRSLGKERKMDPLTSPSSITLVVKTPNQRIKDIEVSCLLDWTVEKLKSHLANVYPTKPARSSQKIIYSGKLLHDNCVLKDVLQENSGSHQTIHLVCTQSVSENSSSQATTPTSESLTSQTTSTPSTSTSSQSTSQPDGLRFRGHEAFAQHPFHNMAYSNFPYANVGQGNVHGNGNFQLHGRSYVYPNAHEIHFAAQQMAHFHVMQQMSQLMGRNAAHMHGIPVMPPHIQQPPQATTSPVPQANHVAAGQQAPQAQGRQENPGENRNMVMNANAGGGMMQEEDEEDRAQRDWLDHIYMAVRVFMLLSIFWFYSSAGKLVIMGVVLILIWLAQSGWFNLNRARRNRQPAEPINQNNNELEDQEEQEGDSEGDPEQEGDSEGETESQPEDQTDSNKTNADNHVLEPEQPRYWVVCYHFFVTFFTSLIPQAPQPVAQP